MALRFGHPSKEKAQLQEHLAKLDAAEPNAIEVKFGESKRHYGMGLISTHLQETSEAVIAMQLLVMNLERKLRLLFSHFFKRYFGCAKYTGLFENRSAVPKIDIKQLLHF